MEKNQRAILICMKLLKNIMVIFTTIFLNVYIFKSLNNNFELYLYGIIFTVIISQIFSLVILKLLTRKNAMAVYRFSFVFDIFLIVCVLFIKNPTFSVVLLFYVFQELSNTCFYVPHEIGEMKATDSGNTNRFLAKSTIFTSFVKVLSPFLSGFVISQTSYALLFVIIGFVALAMFVLSFFMDDFDIKSNKLQLKEFSKKIFCYQHAKNFYLSFCFFRLSMGGTIYTILPVVLFMKVGSEFSLGSYSSLFSLLTILTLSVFMFVQNKKFNIILSTVMISFSCLLLTFFTNIYSFIVFNALYYMFEKLFENEIFSMRLNVIKLPDLSDFKKEHHVFYDIFANLGYLAGFLSILILYKTIHHAEILSIIISTIGLLIIVSSVLLIKSKQGFLELQKNLVCQKSEKGG